MAGSTPSTWPASRPPGPRPGRRRGPRVRHVTGGSRVGCRWTWTPRSPSTIPMPSRIRLPPGNGRTGSPPVAGVPGPPRHRRRRSPGRDAASGANAGSNTTADHVQVLAVGVGLVACEPYRPRPADPAGPRALIRSHSAGATHGFAQACRAAGVGFSFGFPVTEKVRAAVQVLADAAATAAELGFRRCGTRRWRPTEGKSATAPGSPKPPALSTCPPGRPAPG